MTDPVSLDGKRILAVDDEPDILATLVELLDMCTVDTAPDFPAAVKLLRDSTYDAAVFDIMGVDGYQLLRMAAKQKIPTLMLTSHALTPDNLVKSLKLGAHIYLPKDRMAEIKSFLEELIDNKPAPHKKSGRWFIRLLPFFNERFGKGWREPHAGFWNTFTDRYEVSKDYLNSPMWEWDKKSRL